MVGAGPSYVLNNLYLDPAINKATNAVVIEDAGHIRSNISLGVVFTPWVTTKIREVPSKKRPAGDTVYAYEATGPSFALFLNPINVTKLSDVSLATNVDLGLGVGYRNGSVSFLATLEFFGVRQPRDYFVERYKSNDKTYIINNQTQTTISPTDNDVFRNKLVTAIGFKMAFTFDIIKQFVAGSKQ
jgi:hypothetical protein